MKKIDINKKFKIVKSVDEKRKEFFDFIKDYSVLQLAIGVVIGNAVKDLTNSIATNVIVPFIGLFTPDGIYENLSFSVRGSEFKIGLLLNSIVDFLIVALIVFIVIKKIFRIEVQKK